MRGTTIEGPLWEEGFDTYKTPVPTRPFIFYCGCGSIRTKMERAIRDTPAQGLETVQLNANSTARRYADLKRLASKMPSLGTGSYAVLHANGKLINLIVDQNQLEALREKIREVMNTEVMA